MSTDLSNSGLKDLLLLLLRSGCDWGRCQLYHFHALRKTVHAARGGSRDYLVLKLEKYLFCVNDGGTK